MQPAKLSQNKLARTIKVPPRRINEIIHAKRAITADTATRLSIYFGNSACYWMQLQAKYDIRKIRSNITAQLSAITLPTRITTENKETKSHQTTTTSNIKKRIMR